MLCPICQDTNSRVLESRSAESGKSIRRRRECMNCQHRFTTYERIEFLTITIIKRDGKKEPFNKSKLLRGIIRSCEKTGIEVSQLEAFVNQIEVKLQGRCQREITSAEIGEIVLSKLSGISEVAYIRFASDYRKFQGIRDFVDTLNHLQNQKENLEFTVTLPQSSEISLKQDTPKCETAKVRN